MASRSLDDLDDATKAAAMRLLELARRQRIELLVYCTARSLEEQAALYASGRTVPGRILTNARPGQSKHNPAVSGKAAAFDCVPLIGGKPQWNDVELLNKVGILGESCGLVWAGRWRGALRERVHFET